MSQQQPPTDPHESERTSIAPPGAQPDEGATLMGGVPISQPAPEQQEQLVLMCANCGQPLEAGTNFCQSCGTPVSAAAAADPEPGIDEPPRRWFPLLLVLWLIVMVAALYFMFSSAIQVGPT